MDRQTDTRTAVDGWMDGWMDEWMNQLTVIGLLTLTSKSKLGKGCKAHMKRIRWQQIEHANWMAEILKK